ncbi:maternal embryonic leucine zipper kinase [Reticulomyxa filosa]|uniref:Maternal embryonic leucine zipper kinase n=1 Tax=Reticulomyxa filosa TaxID=46433 RepID=X6P329_RETFI|nr:maternal embryonic leucine zipper kinase [Reticulomyxa filosa]|eukprot:ETO31967.1 maternal embryonic leucine zipper kinase [Reticulomyxa filosa]
MAASEVEFQTNEENDVVNSENDKEKESDENNPKNANNKRGKNDKYKVVIVDVHRVKKGYDKKTSKCVALKFMAKADQSWSQEQTKQVIIEIEALKKVRHQNVIKLYAYNLNAKYPMKNNERLDCILLVLEYAPAGELFDILYYTSALEPVVARTYFRQFIAGRQKKKAFVFLTLNYV